MRTEVKEIILKIKGKQRAFTVSNKLVPSDRLRSDLLARGWDGICYMLTGVNGGCYLAYRSAQTGTFEVVK